MGALGLLRAGAGLLRGGVGALGRGATNVVKAPFNSKMNKLMAGVTVFQGLTNIRPQNKINHIGQDTLFGNSKHFGNKF